MIDLPVGQSLQQARGDQSFLEIPVWKNLNMKMFFPTAYQTTNFYSVYLDMEINLKAKIGPVPNVVLTPHLGDVMLHKMSGSKSLWILQ